MIWSYDDVKPLYGGPQMSFLSRVFHEIVCFLMISAIVLLGKATSKLDQQQKRWKQQKFDMKSNRFNNQNKNFECAAHFLPSLYHLRCQTWLEWQCDHAIFNIQDCCFINGDHRDFISSEIPTKSFKTMSLFELADIQKITLRHVMMYEWM